MNRRQHLALVAGAVTGLGFAGTRPLRAQAADPLSRDAVLRDREIPPAGNADGDVTIVEYFDYQCSYCKTIAAVLSEVSGEDGRIRIVLKDWPIFGELSVQAARLVLAAKYQDKYHAGHFALMGASGRLTPSRLLAVLKDAGVDLDRAGADLDRHSKAIDALLARNAAQAEAFGFPGTPSFIVGTFRVPGVPTKAQFRQMIADVRAGKDKR